jgi:hypothetical protein
VRHSLRSAALFPLLLVGACLGGRVHVDEWTDIAIEQKVDVWTQGQHWRLHGVTVLLDSITGIPSDVALSCDSCRVGFPRSRIDSVVTRHTNGLVEGVLAQGAAISVSRVYMYLISLIP